MRRRSTATTNPAGSGPRCRAAARRCCSSAACLAASISASSPRPKPRRSAPSSAFLSRLWRGKLRGKTFWHVMAETTATTAMIYGLIFGAQIFSFFVGVSALTESATSAIGASALGADRDHGDDPRRLSAARLGDGILRGDGHHRADRDAASSCISATTSCGGASSISASSRPASSIRRSGSTSSC